MPVCLCASVPVCLAVAGGTVSQATVCYFFDTLVGLKGPAVPGLASWCKAKRPGEMAAPAPVATGSGPGVNPALQAALDPVFHLLFETCDGTLVPRTTTPFPWVSMGSHTTLVPEATPCHDAQVWLYAW